MRGRWCYTPMAGKINRNPPTLMERIRRRLRKREKPDVFPIVDYYPAIYPNKNAAP